MNNMLFDYMKELKNYTFKLLFFLIYNNNETNNQRYTLQSLMVLTGLPSSTLQKGIKELEEKNILHRNFVGVGSKVKNAPEFILNLNSCQYTVE